MTESTATATRAGPFLRSAFDHAAAGARSTGDYLRLSPRWATWTYRLLAGAFAIALGFVSCATVHEYASGPAVIVSSGRHEITAVLAGTVESVDVVTGETVGAHAPLVRLHAAKERAELERVQREFDIELAKTLRDPSNQQARVALASLAAQKELATARLEHQTLRAPGAGQVGDLRIRPGQYLSAGDIVLTLTAPDATCSVVAMLPARHRPELRAEMPLRFEVDGYRFVYEHATIASIAAQIIGATEVRRYLGPEIADTVKVEGPVEIVRADLPSCAFNVDGERLSYHHGMSGAADVRLRKKRILFVALPWLRAVFGKGEP